MSNHLTQRLEYLDELGDGWLDGQGVSISSEGIAHLKGELALLIGERGLPEPFLYPTLTGGVQAEWSLGSWEVSATFSFDPYFRAEGAEEVPRVLEVSLFAVDLSQREDRWEAKEVLFDSTREAWAAIRGFVLQFVPPPTESDPEREEIEHDGTA